LDNPIGNSKVELFISQKTNMILIMFIALYSLYFRFYDSTHKIRFKDFVLLCCYLKHKTVLL